MQSVNQYMIAKNVLICIQLQQVFIKPSGNSSILSIYKQLLNTNIYTTGSYSITIYYFVHYFWKLIKILFFSNRMTVMTNYFVKDYTLDEVNRHCNIN